jgi:hypothetical protein
VLLGRLHCIYCRTGNLKTTNFRSDNKKHTQNWFALPLSCIYRASTWPKRIHSEEFALTSALARVHAEVRGRVTGAEHLLVLGLAVPARVEAPRPVRSVGRNRKTARVSCKEDSRTTNLRGRPFAIDTAMVISQATESNQKATSENIPYIVRGADVGGPC